MHTNHALQALGPFSATGVDAVLASLNTLPAEPDCQAAQQLLFPATPRAVCDEMGLNWWAALKLFEDGWLSFQPETTLRLNDSQEAELRFVGALVLAGCDRPMLATLLSGLPKPYAYHGSGLYFDWTTHQWRSLHQAGSNSEAVFTDWLETLVVNGDTGSLRGIIELASDALARVNIRSGQQELNPYSE
jgi:hypothetical protein